MAFVAPGYTSDHIIFDSANVWARVICAPLVQQRFRRHLYMWVGTVLIMLGTLQSTVVAGFHAKLSRRNRVESYDKARLIRLHRADTPTSISWVQLLFKGRFPFHNHQENPTFFFNGFQYSWMLKKKKNNRPRSLIIRTRKYQQYSTMRVQHLNYFENSWFY